MNLKITCILNRRIPVAIAALALASIAQGAGLGVFNTGVDGTGTPLPDGTPGDPHYTLISVPGGVTDLLVRTSSGGVPVPPWLPDSPLSAWIGPSNDSILDGPVGLYDYQTTFDLSGMDLSTALLTGQWAADNSGVDILINGVSTGNTAGGFDAWSAFTVSNGFVAGINTLDFMVNNDGGPTGVRVELTGSASTLASAPEPGSLWLLGAGIAGLSLLRRRVSKAAACSVAR